MISKKNGQNDFITDAEECMFLTMLEKYKNLWASMVKYQLTLDQFSIEILVDTWLTSGSHMVKSQLIFSDMPLEVDLYI